MASTTTGEGMLLYWQRFLHLFEAIPGLLKMIAIPVDMVDKSFSRHQIHRFINIINELQWDEIICLA